ncbi:MAG: type I methionyl aminopeptidase [Bacteroidales bacterium]|jgi:methionyl aminopeptidase|nr:type I methionyl aminopeptidase [Bacteroidales bacterium]
MFASKGIYIKNHSEIELMRESALLVGATLAEVSKHIKFGVKTKELDMIAEDFIYSHNAIPTFKGYNGFPASLCISINEVIIHGIPGEREIKEGDVISIDCGVTLNGWVGDSAYTFATKGISEEAKKLLQCTKNSLYAGINKCILGQRVGDVGAEIQNYCESFGYGVVREFCGHGVGKKMHEKPDVPNYGKKGSGIKFCEGMVIAVEPMITMGKKDVMIEKDEWTCRTVDMSIAAHFEHDVAITINTPDVLSNFEQIEIVIKQNDNLELV